VYAVVPPTEPPAAEPTGTPASTASPSAGAPSLPPATPTATLTAEPSGTSGPAASSTPGRTGTPTETGEPVESDPPATDPAGTAEPTTGADVSQPPATSVPEPSASPAQSLAIASGVVVRDQSAAYSPDGRWFAFSAWPGDGSHGSDIYLWRVGDLEAAPVTNDHRSVFSSWYGDTLIGSRVLVDDHGGAAEPIAGAADATVEPEPESDAAPEGLRTETFLLDPDTLVESAFAHPTAWRPVASPDGGSFVYWSGTVVEGADGLTYEPGTGRLVLVQDAALADAPADADASAAPDASPTDGGDVEPAFVGELRQVISSGPIRDFDVRWNETGSHVGVWVAGVDDPAGTLSLYEVRQGRGDTSRPARRLLSGEPAESGFSIGRGRLAWATPEDPEGAVSRVHVVAWSTTGVGSVETAPRGRGGIVIIR
jgi:hypothetical protein